MTSHLGTRWRWVVRFTPQPSHSRGSRPWYPSGKGLGGLHSRSGRGSEEKILASVPLLDPRIPISILFSNSGIRAGRTVGVLVLDSRRGLGIFLFTTMTITSLGPTQPPIQWVPGALSLGGGGLKQLGREADHSPPSSAEVKNSWSYTSTPQYVFMALYFVKHSGKFTFN
jgi:hypothetical protein